MKLAKLLLVPIPTVPANVFSEPPTLMLPPTPSPPGPTIIKSPVVGLTLTTLPFRYILLLVIPPPAFIVPAVTKLPPMYALPPIPAPPGTINAPVVVLVDGVAFVMLRLPICIGPLSKLITFELP